MGCLCKQPGRSFPLLSPLQWEIQQTGSVHVLRSGDINAFGCTIPRRNVCEGRACISVCSVCCPATRWQDRHCATIFRPLSLILLSRISAGLSVPLRFAHPLHSSLLLLPALILPSVPQPPRLHRVRCRAALGRVPVPETVCLLPTPLRIPSSVCHHLECTKRPSVILVSR
jgi:hypothetical protein